LMFLSPGLVEALAVSKTFLKLPCLLAGGGTDWLSADGLVADVGLGVQAGT